MMSEEERLQLLKSRMLKKQQKKEHEAAQTKKATSESSNDTTYLENSNTRDSTDTYFANYNLINNYLTNSEVRNF